MAGLEQIDADHDEKRRTLTGVGAAMIFVGGILATIGLGDFLCTMSHTIEDVGGRFAQPVVVLDATGRPSIEHPQSRRVFPALFWCAFIGLPLAAWGVKIVFFSNIGRVRRYMAAELTPVATDTLDYAARRAGDGIRNVARSVAEGVAEATAAETKVRGKAGRGVCPACGQSNKAGAQFCSNCGKEIQKPRACGNCGHQNAADANFCDQCGRMLL